jgi:Fe-S cluster assembly protein SufD
MGRSATINGPSGNKPAGNKPAVSKGQVLLSFDPADFPELTGREEDWRFTPLDRLTTLFTGTPDGATTRPLIQQRAQPTQVTCDWVDRDDPRIGSVLTPFDRLSALAYQRFTQAMVVRVPASTVLAQPLELTVAADRSGQPTYGHTFLEIGELAEATVVLEQIGSGQLADNVEVTIGDGARLVLVTVDGAEDAAVHAQHLRFRLGRDARVTHVQVALGGSLVRQYTSVEYTAPGAECESYGVYFARAGQHLEHRLLVDHSVPDCRSQVVYRGALNGRGSHTVWVGDVLIRAAATGTDTYEINRNLVLSDGARADSVPNLEIETGEVVGAGHASTTGRFDDDQLFYLMARGIPAEQARRLVVRGFFAELLAMVPLEDLRQRLADRIEAGLADERTAVEAAW